VRGGRSPRAWRWDVAGAACVIAALGCKNTFAALVPAQILLRVAPGGEPLGPAVRARGPRAALLALTVLLPVVHFAVFISERHAGQYDPGAPTWGQLVRMIDRVQAGISLGYIAPALLLAIAMAYVGRGAGIEGAGRRGLGDVWRHHRAACRAGVALLLAGIAVYLPLDFVGNRYAIPAMWGALLLIGALLTEVVRTVRRRANIVLAIFAVGVIAAGVENLVRQDRFRARAALLWDTLEIVEREAPAGTTIAWPVTPELTLGEGVHFYWHIQARGRPDLRIHLLDPAGGVVPREEVRATDVPPTLRITGGLPDASPAPGWIAQHDLRRAYRWGWREHRVVVWRKEN
jgi:hypothetical protein